MKKFLSPLVLSALLLLSSCGGTATTTSTPADGGDLTIAATTYPVYLFTTAVTEGVDGVAVQAVINQPMSCLHDYTLTVNDMKSLEGADVIALNGVGLEDFMEDAFQTTSATLIDCSSGVELLPYEEHEGHSHGEDEEDGDHYDPHIWMSPDNAAIMVQNLADGLSAADPDHADQYQRNCTAAIEQLHEGITLDEDDPGSPADDRLITFHDGFRYFANFFGFRIEKAIEEEEGSEASAAEIKEIVTLVQTYEIPVLFTEVNGSDTTAQAIARETGVGVAPLTMIMSGSGEGIQPYLDAINQNYAVIRAAFTTEGGA